MRSCLVALFWSELPASVAAHAMGSAPGRVEGVLFCVVAAILLLSTPVLADVWSSTPPMPGHG